MKIKHLIIAVILLSASFIPLALRAADYTLLEPLPIGETPGQVVSKVDTGAYISNLFNLLIALALVIAVFRLIYAGIIYITTSISSQKSDAKGIIQETLSGLALTLGAWLIVATIIGPDKLSVTLSLPSVEVPPDTNAPGTDGGGGVLPGYTLTAAQVAENNQIRADLLKNRPSITVNNGPCATGGTTGCTNVVGLPSSAINGVKSLASACGCSIEITGGTEGGHTDHGPGRAAVDLSPTSALNGYLAKTNPAAANPVNKLKVSVGGATYTYEVPGANGRATGYHWHVQY